jgi:integrase
LAGCNGQASPQSVHHFARGHTSRKQNAHWCNGGKDKGKKAIGPVTVAQCLGHIKKLQRGASGNRLYHVAQAFIECCGEETPANITPAHLHKVCAQALTLKNSRTTRYHAASHIRKVIDILIAAGSPYALRALVPRLPRPSPRAITVTTAEFELMLKAAQPWLKLMLLLCHDAALRFTAAHSLTPAQFKNGLITSRGKFGLVTAVPATSRLAAMLANAPETKDETYIARYRGKHLHEYTVRAHFKTLCKRVGVSPLVTLHDLRRTAAERTYNATADLRVVQQLLGHTTLAATTHYLQRPGSPASRARLAAALETLCP